MLDRPDVANFSKGRFAIRWMRPATGRSADLARPRRVGATHLRRGASVALRLSFYLLPFLVIVAALISKLYP